MKLISAKDPRAIHTLLWFYSTFPELGDAGFERYFLCKIVEIENEFFLKFDNDAACTWFALVTTGSNLDAKYTQPFDFESNKTIIKDTQNVRNNCASRERVHESIS